MNTESEFKIEFTGFLMKRYQSMQLIDNDVTSFPQQTEYINVSLELAA
jgi:hypothetical protein